MNDRKEFGLYPHYVGVGVGEASLGRDSFCGYEAVRMVSFCRLGAVGVGICCGRGRVRAAVSIGGLCGFGYGAVREGSGSGSGFGYAVNVGFGCDC